MKDLDVLTANLSMLRPLLVRLLKIYCFMSFLNWDKVSEIGALNTYHCQIMNSYKS